MLMHNPPHPGEVLRKLCLEPLGLTVTQAAKALNVSRKTLSAILNGRAGISPEMAVRLSMPLIPQQKAGSVNRFSMICGVRSDAAASCVWLAYRRRRASGQPAYSNAVALIADLQRRHRILGTQH